MPCDVRRPPSHLAPRPGLPPAGLRRPGRPLRPRRAAADPAGAGRRAGREHGLRPRGRQAPGAARAGRGAPRRRHGRARLAGARRPGRARAPDRARGRAGQRDGALRDGGAAPAALRVGAARRDTAQRRAGGAAGGAGRAGGRGRGRRDGTAPRLRVLRRADPGGRQRRLPARHELDPGAVPGEPRALSPARLDRRSLRGRRSRRGRRRRGRRGGHDRRARRRAGSTAAAVKVLTPREAAVFAAFTDAVALPEAPFPPVAGTEAVAGLDAWLAAAPAANRAAVRASLLVVGSRLRGRDRAGRAEWMRCAPQLIEPLRAVAAAAYYGDEGVMRRLGYDAAERVRRGAEVRAAANGHAPPAAAPSKAARFSP